MLSYCSHIQNEARSWRPSFPSSLYQSLQVLDIDSKYNILLTEKVTMADDYQYNNLADGEIRLINILPGTAGDELKCGMLTCSLTSGQNLSDLPYEALSYVWGSPVQVHRLKCDPAHIVSSEGAALACSQDPDHSIGITANLRDALLHLRQENDMRTIWVDAICIN